MSYVVGNGGALPLRFTIIVSSLFFVYYVNKLVVIPQQQAE